MRSYIFHQMTPHILPCPVWLYITIQILPIVHGFEMHILLCFSTFLFFPWLPSVNQQCYMFWCKKGNCKSYLLIVHKTLIIALLQFSTCHLTPVKPVWILIFLMSQISKIYVRNSNTKYIFILITWFIHCNTKWFHF